MQKILDILGLWLCGKRITACYQRITAFKPALKESKYTVYSLYVLQLFFVCQNMLLPDLQFGMFALPHAVYLNV